MTDQTRKTIPINARWIINGKRDLPQTYAPATYLVTVANGGTAEVTLRKRNRQVLEALIVGPIYAASPVRLSDNVMILRRDYGIVIRTDFYEDDGGPINTRYGVYTLTSNVERVASESAVAA